MSRASSASPALRELPAQACDDDLVASIRGGDDRAFEALYDRYRRPIAAFASSMVRDHGRAEDITQEVFMSALRRIRETQRPIAFKPWVYEIARNACIDHFRRTKRAEELSYDADGALAPDEQLRLASGPRPDTAVELKQELDQLASAFGGLSDSHHRILVLRELEGLSYREIGDRMGLTRPAVESTLFRARRRLTEEYDDLASGRRCRRVQSIIAGAAEGMLGARDRARMQRHLSHCQACRKHARLLGVEPVRRGGLAARMAAWLPLPLWSRREGGSGLGGLARQDPSGTLAQISATLGAGAETAAAGWAKAVLAAATVAVAGVGAGVAGQRAGIVPLGPRPASSAHQARHGATKRTPASPRTIGARTPVVERSRRPVPHRAPARTAPAPAPAPAVPQGSATTPRAGDSGDHGTDLPVPGGPKLPALTGSAQQQSADLPTPPPSSGEQSAPPSDSSSDPAGISTAVRTSLASDSDASSPPASSDGQGGANGDGGQSQTGTPPSG